jgi:hypothetical protein
VFKTGDGSDLKTMRQVLLMVYWEVREAEFHLIASNPLLSPKQHKETAATGLEF